MRHELAELACNRDAGFAEEGDPMVRGTADSAGFPGGSQAGTGHAFLSYARADARRVDRLQQALEAAGVPVWRDTDSLWPGEDWRAKIRGAISRDALVFIACFSSHSAARQTSYQNEELLLAIDQLRRRRPDDPWLIPVRFDDCDIPDLELGAGRTLTSIQRADLFGGHSGAELARLVTTVSRILRGNSGKSRSKSWRQAAAVARRRPVVVPSVIAVLLTIVAYVVLQMVHSGGGLTVTGSVVCESGRPVVGVWVAASTGQGNSGYAHLGPPDASGTSFPIGAAGTYSYRLPHGGSYAVHVGCGGTAQQWASSNYSPLLSSPAAHLHCADPISLTHGASPQGSCRVTAT
jgi:hypothetical protein